MGTLFVYVLKSSLCLALFYLFYRWLLSKETFHCFNRYALLGVLLLSLLVPFCHISLKETTEVHQTFLNIEQLLLLSDNDDMLVEVHETPFFSWMKVVLLLYALGVVFFFFRNLYSIARMWLLLKNSEREKLDSGVVLIIHHKKVAPFSWLKYIVISEEDRKESEKEIVTHELAHIKKRHWLDLLLSEITILFHWFNPAAWLLKQELQNIHEYEADESVINQGIDAKQYQLLLIKKAVGSVRFNSLANSFNHSKLKKRITMMLKEKSSPWARLKYLYVLPLTAIAITAFARPEISDKLDEISKVKVNAFSLNMEEKQVKSDTTVIKEEAYSIIGAKIENSNIVSDTTTAILAMPDKYFGESATLSSSLEAKLQIKDEVFPLILIDNKEATRQEMDALDAEIIKSITVLKNETSTKIYGTKGKNGVIIISLKKNNQKSELDTTSVRKEKVVITTSKGLSVDGKTPIFLVDGKEMDRQEFAAINPENIASISVLKDKSATEIYGDKGKNGVVIITLKKSVSHNFMDENQVYKDCSVSVCHKSKPGEYIWEIKDFTLKELREEFRKLPVIEDMVVVTSVLNDMKPEMVDALKNTLREERALKVNMETKNVE